MSTVTPHPDLLRTGPSSPGEPSRPVGTHRPAEVERRLVERQVAGACRDLGVFGVPDLIPDAGSTPGEVVAGLLDAGDRVEVAQTVLTDALEGLALWVDAAPRAGLPREHVLRLAGRPYRRPPVLAHLPQGGASR